MRKYSVSIDIDLEDIKDEIISYCQKNFYPEEIFTEGDLKKWAEESDYTKGE